MEYLLQRTKSNLAIAQQRIEDYEAKRDLLLEASVLFEHLHAMQTNVNWDRSPLNTPGIGAGRGLFVRHDIKQDLVRCLFMDEASFDSLFEGTIQTPCKIAIHWESRPNLVSPEDWMVPGNDDGFLTANKRLVVDTGDDDAKFHDVHILVPPGFWSGFGDDDDGVEDGEVFESKGVLLTVQHLLPFEPLQDDDESESDESDDSSDCDEPMPDLDVCASECGCGNHS